MDSKATIIELRQAVSPALLRLCAALEGRNCDSSPLDVLAARRMGLLLVCAAMDALPNAGKVVIRDAAAGIAAFLRTDYHGIIIEEEEGLLARLRPRLLIGDDLDDAIRQMQDEHRRDRQEAVVLAGKCEELATGLGSDEAPATFASLRAFAERQRRHLAWEDAIIFPIARDRLTSDDLSQWMQAMRKRQRSVS
jgi:hemerythrin-like domain-containing protein